MGEGGGVGGVGGDEKKGRMRKGGGMKKLVLRQSTDISNGVSVEGLTPSFDACPLLIPDACLFGACP